MTELMFWALWFALQVLGVASAYIAYRVVDIMLSAFECIEDDGWEGY